MNTDIRYKNILVTGGAGFIGSNLCRKLINDGVSIWCLDNLIFQNWNSKYNIGVIRLNPCYTLFIIIYTFLRQLL